MINWLLNNKQDADAISFGGYVTRGMALFFTILFLYQLWIFLHICWWVKFNPSSTAFMEDRLDVIQEKKPDAELKHKWVDYKKISIHLKRAVIAAEDAKFLDHEGFDWEGIQKAYEKNLKKGKIVAGGSTISQQLKSIVCVCVWMLNQPCSAKCITKEEGKCYDNQHLCDVLNMCP